MHVTKLALAVVSMGLFFGWAGGAGTGTSCVHGGI